MPQANITPKKRPNWSELRVEYVNGTMSQRELAAAHDINASGVMARAAKEKWEDERKQKQAAISSAAQEKLTEDRTDQLAKFNEDDLKVARAIRGKAAQMMQIVGSPQDLRALASAMEVAQKIGRTALGLTDKVKLLGDPDSPLVMQIVRKVIDDNADD